VLKLSNGQRRQREILAELVQRTETGTLMLAADGAPIGEVHTAGVTLPDLFEKALSVLARGALLVE
jgi:hypothetical protein